MLRINAITKSFGPVHALRDVSLDLEEGEFISFLGPSGCGKTTLLRMIAGLDAPTSGDVVANGEVLASETVFVPPEKRRFGMVFQSYALWPHMTVGENLSLPLEIAGVGRTERAARIQDMLALIGLKDLGPRYAAQLSGGQQQRVALGRALISRPRALLLDEPLSNVDAKVRREMRFEIRRVQREAGVTAVYVTHDQEEALAMSDRIVVMDHGCIVQVGTPADIFRRPQSEYVASFFGNNVLEGFVTAKSGRECRVTIWGLGLEMAVSSDVDVGSKVLLAVHPKHTHVTEKGGQDRGTATVSGISYLGDVFEIELVAKSRRFIGTFVGEKPTFGEGSQVSVSLDDGYVWPIGGHEPSPATVRPLSDAGVLK
jgi:ABC-type Fe3+/spermidine/putrescine transport system ATPase subunit